ncbi:MAG: hypothetical protein HN509_06415 [Halobacteriovoraceae bacterium]|jgi:hypothetical protein|nr:hypothetical protein [Halobacteriovoraceae bacterium]
MKNFILLLFLGLFTAFSVHAGIRIEGACENLEVSKFNYLLKNRSKNLVELGKSAYRRMDKVNQILANPSDHGLDIDEPGMSSADKFAAAKRERDMKKCSYSAYKNYSNILTHFNGKQKISAFEKLPVFLKKDTVSKEAYKSLVNHLKSWSKKYCDVSSARQVKSSGGLESLGLLEKCRELVKK